MALLTAAGDLLVLLRVDKAVDALLMQVERSLLPVVQILQLVHVDEAVERAREQHDKVFVVLDLRDPAPVCVHFETGEAPLLAAVLRRPLVL